MSAYVVRGEGGGLGWINIPWVYVCVVNLHKLANHGTPLVNRARVSRISTHIQLRTEAARRCKSCGRWTRVRSVSLAQYASLLSVPVDLCAVFSLCHTYTHTLWPNTIHSYIRFDATTTERTIPESLLGGFCRSTRAVSTEKSGFHSATQLCNRNNDCRQPHKQTDTK